MNYIKQLNGFFEKLSTLAEKIDEGEDILLIDLLEKLVKIVLDKNYLPKTFQDEIDKAIKKLNGKISMISKKKKKKRKNYLKQLEGVCDSFEKQKKRLEKKN